MSSDESFGISLLEALTAGSRVVASDIPAHREVAALGAPGSVVLIPHSAGPEALAAAIRQAASGRVNSPITVPTWDDAAYLTLEVYQSLLRSNAPARRGPA
jgi:glycosyltransferase involved in cell wall biosynthesis